MRPILRIGLVLLLLQGLAGCASKGTKDDDADEFEVAPTDIRYQLSKGWSRDLGIGSAEGKLVLARNGDRLFATDASGKVVALSLDTGGQHWQRKFKKLSITGGLDAAFDSLALATRDGAVLLLDQSDGSERWRAQVSGEVLASPVSNGDVVLVQALDGSLTAFDFEDGSERWIYRAVLPALSLHGTASPLYSQGFFFAGFSNGKLVMLSADKGLVRWEQLVTLSEGRSELERVIDVDARPAVSARLVFAASYQGHLSAIDIVSGKVVWSLSLSSFRDLALSPTRVVVSDATGRVKLVRQDSGEVTWDSRPFKEGVLSAPAVAQAGVVVGDSKGYVHLLDRSTGVIIGRTRFGKNPIVHILPVEDRLFILDQKGKVGMVEVSA